MVKTDDQLRSGLENSESEITDLEVNIAKPGDLSEQDIYNLAESISEGLFEPINVRAKEIRMKIKDTIKSIRKRVILTAGGMIDKWSNKIAHQVFPNYTRQDSIESHRDRIKGLLESGQLMVGKLKGQVVGIVGFQNWGEWEGREVYATVSEIVLDKYRGKKNYKKIKDAVMSHLLINHPDCPILLTTKKTEVKGYMKKYFPGTKEIPFESNHPLVEKLKESYSEYGFKKAVEEGYVILWYDPQTVEKQ